MMRSEGARGGFTIIEVVLVLAIAGLIFLMVFIALPALQRSQRDTQRRDDMSKVTNAITQFQTNNDGDLPDDGVFKPAENRNMPSCAGKESNEGDACRLIRQYINGTNSAKNEFMDPDGWAYGVTISSKTADYVDNVASKVGNESGGLSHMVHVVKKARCQGENVVTSTNSRDYVVLYKLEGSGIYCQDNG